MSYDLRITSAAWRDMEAIFDWIAENDSPEKALAVLDGLTETASTLAELPQRGSRPRELPPHMDAEYRQIFFKPYRLIYEIAAHQVIIHIVADGRRNLQSLLKSRLQRH